MQAPGTPSNEVERLQALHDSGLLDTPAEERFDRLTRLAQQLTGAPIAVVSLVDADRQWFKSRQGLDACETGRDVSFCGHAILDDTLMEVEDARRDPRFADNPLVAGAPGIRFYAGAPLSIGTGKRVGTLCVIDTRPRQLSAEQRQALRDLADCVEAELNMAEERSSHAVLAASEARFRALADAAPALIWLADTHNRGTWFNRRWLEFTGRRLEQELGTGWAEGIHPDDLSRCAGTCEAAFAARRAFDMEFRLRRADGGYGWIADTGIPQFDEGGTFQGYIGYCWDISDRKAAELELRRNEQRLVHLVSASPVAIYACSAEAPYGANFVTASVETMTGWRSEQFIADPAFWAERIHPDERERVLAGLEHLFERGEHRHEYRFRCANGGYIWITDSLRVVYDSDLRPVELVGSWLDISEQKRVDALKREFVSTVSHELRTPLTAISGALGLIAGGVVEGATGELREMVKVAHQNCLRLAALIDDLLDMEKLAAGKLRFDMQEQALLPIIDAALRENQAYADHFGVRLEWAGRCPDVRVSVDSGRLRQVLANLISNAVKFSPKGESVLITVGQSDGGVRISVSDRGPGVPAAFKARIFEKFSQADASDARPKGGTGLGLAISRELGQRMGGRIGFDSEEGRGAVFWFELPCRAIASAELTVIESGSTLTMGELDAASGRDV